MGIAQYYFGKFERRIRAEFLSQKEEEVKRIKKTFLLEQCICLFNKIERKTNSEKYSYKRSIKSGEELYLTMLRRTYNGEPIFEIVCEHGEFYIIDKYGTFTCEDPFRDFELEESERAGIGSDSRQRLDAIPEHNSFESISKRIMNNLGI